MKKAGWACLIALLMVLSATVALAEDAMDVTAECTIRASYVNRKITQMTDRKTKTYFETNNANQPWLEITSPPGLPISGLYVCFTAVPEQWEVQIADEDGDWETHIPGDNRFLNTWVQLPAPADKVRLVVTQEGKFTLSVNELYAFSEGDIPAWVQRWEPTEEKADVLFLAAHASDEQLFFGGAIPTYAAEQGRKVIVAYLTGGNVERQADLLNSLWAMGVRHYPVCGDFREKKSSGGVKGAYKDLRGEETVVGWVTELLRKYQPEVVVTHDPEGEDGNNQHKMVADAARKAVTAAAAEGEYLDSFMTYGAWQVKKLYLHLGTERPLTFDWSVPLLSADGRTSLELARDAYALYTTPAHPKEDVDSAAAAYDNRVFGLDFTAVGEDVRGDDFLENIYDSVGSFVPAPTTPAPTAAPTPEPAYVAIMPPLNEKGFLEEGEFIYSSEEQGLWVYVSPTAKIIIERKSDPTQPLTWFEAELWGDVASGEILRTEWRDEEKKAKERGDAAETARWRKAVFAMNTDYFTYRVSSNGSRHTGVVIRDGEILYDDRYAESEVSQWLFPNLDTLAFYPDGSLSVHHSYELTAQDYIDRGAYAVYSFGPYLIKDGELSEKAYTSSDSKNPRCALGMVEPGHYVAVLCEGRLKRSSGVDIAYLSKLMRKKGCQVAFNMDGGQTAVMCFMGKQLNQIGVYDGKTNARPTCDILAFGTSDQVGVYEVK